MAAGSHDPDSPAAGGEIWGTLEELLLACAVNRHGGACWDKVAAELRLRVAADAAARFTPEGCRLRFRLIRRRFAAAAGDDDDDDDDGELAVAAAAESCMEELRKLRMAELRREVHRHDVSIGALESKVKRLKEERERSLSPASEEEEAVNESPEEAGGENRVSGEVSDNSSDLKPLGTQDSDPAAADGHPAVNDEPDAKEENASGESAAASKDAGAEKESSDVQSSASPSKRRLRKSGGGEALSSSAPLPAAEVEPLVAFLESVRASKSGSVFKRRLESQKGGKYRGTIRRHVDLEMIRSKLESGGPKTTGKGGSSCFYTSASEFYRDLLLLCANALVFFPRGSTEHAAAARTRALVSKRISRSLHGGAAEKASASASAAAAAAGGGSLTDGGKKPKPEAEAEGSLMEKSTPIMVSRKRSSIAKAAANAARKEEKVEKADTDGEEEQDEEEDKKKRGSARGRTLRSSKTREPAAMNGSPIGKRTRSKGSAAAAAAEASKKPDKKSGARGKAAAAAEGGVVKKRNAVDFLNRMKQSSSQSTERVSLLETLKLSATEQKKPGRGEGRKDTGSSSSSRRSAAASETPPSRGRRNVGRPPKRAAAPPSPPPPKRAKADERPATRRRGRK